MLRRSLALLTGLLVSLGTTLGANAQSNPTPNPGCTPDVVPVGQANPPGEVEPMAPIWCYNLTPEPTTRVTGANDWDDEFNTNVQMGSLNDGDMGYRVFSLVHNGDTNNHTQHFVNNNHWMVDTSGGANDAPTLRPNRSFTFENGKLVVEADVAAGISDYTVGGGSVWPEIDISMAPSPTNNIVDSLYAYGAFGGYWTVGCRLHSPGPTICSVESALHNVADNQHSCNAAAPSRVMEISDFEHCGTTNIGGNRFGDNGQYFRQCQHNQMDMFCRDRFRLELTKSSLTIYVNGHLYFQDAGWDAAHQLPDSLVNGGQVYTYFSDWRGDPKAPAYRFHWGRLAVNPHDASGNLLPPSAAPSFCLGMPQNTCDMGGMMPSQPVTVLPDPVRVADTRQGGGPIHPSADRCFTVTNQANIPSNAAAVELNVAAVDQTMNGWLTVYPKGQPLPPSSALNFGRGQYAIANNALIPVGNGGQVCVHVGSADAGTGSTDVVLDVNGFLPAGAAGPFTLLADPVRLVDTRQSGPAISSGTSRCFSVAGQNIPANAAAVMLNVTATGYLSPGWLTVYPSDQGPPPASTVNFDTSEDAISNGTLARVGPDGRICVSVGTVGSVPGTSQVVLDATGYIPAGGMGIVSLLPAPARVVDTRTHGGPIAGGQQRCFSVAGVQNISSTATAVIANLTAVGYSQRGWLTASASGVPVPGTSTLNYDPSEYAIANGTMLGIGSDGKVCVTPGTIGGGSGGANVIVDVVGFIDPTAMSMSGR